MLTLESLKLTLSQSTVLRGTNEVELLGKTFVCNFSIVIIYEWLKMSSFPEGQTQSNVKHFI